MLTASEALEWLIDFVEAHWYEYGKITEEPIKEEAEAVLRRALAPPTVLAEGWMKPAELVTYEGREGSFRVIGVYGVEFEDSKHVLIIEAPVEALYGPLEERVSHFRPWLDFWRNTKTFARLIAIRVLVPSKRQN